MSQKLTLFRLNVHSAVREAVRRRNDARTELTAVQAETGAAGTRRPRPRLTHKALANQRREEGRRANQISPHSERGGTYWGGACKRGTLIGQRYAAFFRQFKLQFIE